MLKYTSRIGLELAVKQLAKLSVARKLLHKLSVHTRGPGVFFLRCHRLLPDDEEGTLHFHRRNGLALTPDEFEQALRTFVQNLPLIHMAEALELLLKGKRLSENVAVLTFDESYKTSAELAEPVCRALNVPACFFVTTHHAENCATLWNDQIHGLLDQMAPNPISLPWMDRILRTQSERDRKESARRLLRHLIGYNDVARKKHLKELLALGRPSPRRQNIDAMLTTKDIARLSTSPYISFASHGHEHLPLHSLEPDLLSRELEYPRDILRRAAGNSYVDVFSYPFGATRALNENMLSAARVAGYRAAFTSAPGVARPGENMFSLPRLSISSSPHSLQAYQLQGVSHAIDELLLIALGDKERLPPELEG